MNEELLLQLMLKFAAKIEQEKKGKRIEIGGVKVDGPTAATLLSIILLSHYGVAYDNQTPPVMAAKARQRITEMENCKVTECLFYDVELEGVITTNLDADTVLLAKAILDKGTHVKD